MKIKEMLIANKHKSKRLLKILRKSLQVY